MPSTRRVTNDANIGRLLAGGAFVAHTQLADAFFAFGASGPPERAAFAMPVGVSVFDAPVSGVFGAGTLVRTTALFFASFAVQPS